MDQHPVPQNITGYQFRLVGSMTLKQFGMLAAGIILAVIFYNLPFPAFFRYPFVAIFALGGVGLAFVPINDMPLDRWVTAFFKSIYSPTQYYWHKPDRIPDFLTYTPPPASSVYTPPPPKSEPEKLAEYLGTISPSTSRLDHLESSLIANFNQLISAPPSPSVSPISAPPPRISYSPPPPMPQPQTRPISSTPVPPPKPVSAPPSRPIPPPPQPQSTPPPLAPTPPPSISSATPTPASTPPTNAQTATQTLFPYIPDIPNALIGVVLDSANKVVDNAILEVRDSTSHPVRALKTNKVGQFTIFQPLPNGRYEIEIEKPGLTFDIIKFEAQGKVIPPIQIKAKA